jgi:hypothetical protein
MFTFILIVPSAGSPPLPSDLLTKIEGIRYDYTDSCLVEGPNKKKDGWIRVSRNDDIKDDYDDGELDRVNVDPDKSAFFLIEGGVGARNYPTEFVRGLSIDRCYIIDNDHGCIGDVEKFQNLILQCKEWLHSKSF